jgi:probable addiction module antidote protein
MKTTYAPFDVADHLDNDEAIAEYLSAAVEDPDPGVFLAALGDVAKARGAQIAKDAGPDSN